MENNYYEGITSTIYISTNMGGFSCTICSPQEKFINIDEKINHFIETHGFKLLHVGQETGRNIDDGSPFHASVAILGK